MKNPFTLSFNDSREKAEFKAACTAVDIHRVFVYVSIIFVFELFLLVFDALTSNSDYSTVQWIYRILNSYMAGISALYILISLLF